MKEIELTAEQRTNLFHGVTKKGDFLLNFFLLGSFLFGLILAIFYDTWLVALSIGGLNLVAYYLSKFALPKSTLYQYVASANLAIFMAQFIFQMHGLFEMHFYAFVACTVMIVYANWRLQIPLLIIIVAHHAIFAWLQFSGVEGVYFTQLPYMDLTTFIFHVFLAGVIIFISGLWGWQMEQKILTDGQNAIWLEAVLDRNMAFADEIKCGNLEAQFEIVKDDPLSLSLADMRDHLLEYNQKEHLQSYIQTGLGQLGSTLRNHFQSDLPTLSKAVISNLSKYLDASQGAIFIKDQNEEGMAVLQLYGGYAFTDRKHIRNQIAWGEGLVGQAAMEKETLIFSQLPEDYLLIESGLGTARPGRIIAVPLLVREEVQGVIELAFFAPLDEARQRMLSKASGIIAQTLVDFTSRKKTERLLRESQQLSEELRTQQEQLVTANQELAEQATQLSEQRSALLDQNKEIEQAREAIQLKAEELEHTSKYKSEFLANMSHELRTPLNSILILARMLGQNKNGGLTPKEIEHAHVIHKAGSDLLTLINDILDLSKIESGKLELLIEQVSLEEVNKDMKLLFQELAKEKGIQFTIPVSSQLPSSLVSDRVRIEQILKNLLSNAFKFTEKGGSVSLRMTPPEPGTEFRRKTLAQSEQVIAFAVQDSGIGIPEEKQQAIFEAFQQADGSTSRKYGGTGLGLSISRQLAAMLGGEIHLHSVAGEGSTFTLYLPINHSNIPIEEEVDVSVSSHNTYTLSEARILIVEDHEVQSEGIKTLFEGLQAIPTQAFTAKQALDILESDGPFDCIVLDLKLPDIPGLDLLKTIKEDARWEHQPVVINTSMDLDQKTQASIMQYTNSMVIKSAKSHTRLVDEVGMFLQSITPTPSVEQPIQQVSKELENKEVKAGVAASLKLLEEEEVARILKGRRILLADDDMRNVFALSAVLESYELHLRIASDGQDALDQLAESPEVDLILMDIMMPVMDGYEAIRQIRAQAIFTDTPILALTAKAMKEDRALCIEAGASEYMAKPIDPSHLLSLMCQLIQAQHAPAS
ncbi:MAG: response regulator [Bacteroidota bacterium]